VLFSSPPPLSLHNNPRFIHTTSATYSPDRHGTTIVCVRKNGRICMMGDGMVSMGSIIVKPNAKKIRRIRPKSIGGESSTKPAGEEGGSEASKEKQEDEGTIVGFAGTTADAFTLLERLESKLDEYPGQLARSCVELAKGWRTDKYLRRLEASLLVADAKASFEITGNGDVLESHDGVLGVGSGSAYAMAAARALMEEPNLSAEDVAKRAMRIGKCQI
jgi:ATP-dependent HslUV protease subunit HslV